MDWFMGKGRRKDKESPTPPSGEELKEYLEENNLRDRISDADFFKLIALPPGLDLNEWLATHTISFFNHINMVYGVVSEYCTVDSCPAMTAPDNVQYYWLDDKGKKNKNPAPQYIDCVMSLIENLVNDTSVFPVKLDQTFPQDFEAVVRRITRYLFHVLAHLYHAHYTLLKQLGLHSHLNTLFTHFMVFISKFDLIQDKESDLLLQLFSLLLKNLADPYQNPKLREGLGLPEPDQQNNTLSDGNTPPTGDTPTGAGDTPMDISDSSSTVTHITSETIAVPCSSHKENLSNGGTAISSLCICDNISTTTKDSGCPDDSAMDTNGISKSLPSPSSSLLSSSSSTTSSFLTQSRGETDRPASTSPSEWLANLQVSAT